MPFQLSPGVQVIEKDFTTVVPAVSTSNGAICAPLAWGPIDDPIRISSENELVSLFGKPTAANYGAWFTAANFLSYSNSLLVTRLDSSGALNATSTVSSGITSSDIVVTNPGNTYSDGDVVTLVISSPTISSGTTAVATAVWSTSASAWTVTVSNSGSGYVLASDLTPDVTITTDNSAITGFAGVSAQFAVVSLQVKGVKIKNLDDYLTGFADETSTNGLFAAKFAGTKGNGLKVWLIDAGNWDSTPSAVKQKFSSAPGTSKFAELKGITDDEVHIAVYDNGEGSFSGTPNSLLETFEFLSKLSDGKKEDGTSIFYKTVLNNNSKYLWHLRFPGSNVTSEFLAVNGFSGLGTDGSYLAFEHSSGILFVAAAGGQPNKISITDNALFSALSSFKEFYDNTPDSSTRQILVSGTISNNFAYTVSGIVVNTDESLQVTGYDLIIAESVNAEAVTTQVVDIRSLPKLNWGVSSEEAVQFAGNNTLAVLQDNPNGFVSNLSGGVDDLSSSDAAYQTSYAILANKDDYDISLLPLPGVSSTTAKWVVDNVAEVRKDCVVFISPHNSGNPIMAGASAVTDIKAYKDATQINSSYAVMDSGFKYMYDRYNDTYRWVPLSGDVAGLCARTDLTADPWFSPGGFNRGVVKNIIKLAFSPNQTQRDDLYVYGVNPVVTFRGQGTVLYGDKTMLARPSAFDRINVRRLFIVLEKAISIASRSQLFEFNDAFTRAQFKNLVEPFLRDVQGRRGVSDFRVVCDETNNTGEVIDRNEFVADIYIKPNRSINFITLNFIAARSSISFEEIGA